MAPAFETLDDFAALMRTARGPDAAAQTGAAERNGQLTKPPGALGRLEDLAIWYGAWRGMARPVLVAPQIVIFAGNHGVAARGVSAFPPEVTAQMVGNFQAGGAAINQLARTFGARMQVAALELDRPTADFTQAEALGDADCVAALRAGWDAVDPASDLLVVGEMGIGNTTAAAAIAAALYGGGAEAWVGRGTGVDDAGLAVKRDVVDAGLARHGGVRGLAALSAFGGREMAAMAGAMVRAHRKYPADPRRVHLLRRRGLSGNRSRRRTGPRGCRPSKQRRRAWQAAGGTGKRAAVATGPASGRRLGCGAGDWRDARGRGLPERHGDLCRGRRGGGIR